MVCTARPVRGSRLRVPARHRGIAPALSGRRLALFILRYSGCGQGNARMFLMNLPIGVLGLILIGIPTLLAVLGPVLVRRFVDLRKLQTNNEVAGFKFATVGVLYAVMLAFVVIVVWEKFNDADNFVSKEAAAAATVYRLSADIPGEPGSVLRARLTDYLNAAIEKDWAAMAEGEGSPAVTVALDRVYEALLSYRGTGNRDAVILAETLRNLDLLAQARRSRLVAADGYVPGVLWATLIVGAIGTLGFTLFFGTRNLRAQAAMTGILSVLLFSGLLIVVSFDHPFSGSVQVHPDALAAVLRDFGGVQEPGGH